MSLQTKFALLLGLLALTTAAILTAALTFGEFMEIELVRPFERTTTVLRGLAEIKEKNGELTALLPGPARDEPGTDFFAGSSERSGAAPSPAIAAKYEALAAEADDSLRRLQAVEAWHAAIGASTAESLAAQIGEARAEATRWFIEGDPATGIRAGTAQYQVHELIETIERRLVNDAPKAIAYGAEMRGIHRTLTISGLAAAGLFALLCVMLFRRWVIRPVQALRRAALRIGEGEFGHRVPVASRDELGLLSGEVNRMAELVATIQADAVERERLAATGEMVRRLAHNIRNPLSAIRGLAELTRRRAGGDEAIRNDQSEIILSVDRFNTWLTDLLSVTAPKGLVPQETVIEPWIRGLVDSHRPLARMREVGLEVAVDKAPASAVFDARHLEHAVVAILTNAIQASPSGGVVRVSVAGEDGANWAIRVSDQGAGISPENREQIFRPYFTTKRDGTGIGLAIARQIVKEHGGEISVFSAPGEGATFQMSLPRVRSEPSIVADGSQAADFDRSRSESWVRS